MSVVVITTTVAGADPAAEKLFRDGKALIKAGKVAEACDAFARSDKLEPRVGTMLNLADCRERQGRTATAWELFLVAKARAGRIEDVRAADAASDRAAVLERQLAYLTIKVAPERAVDGLVIKRDGEPVSSAAWNMAVPIDPAEYTIEAIAPSHNRWSITQAVKPRDRITVTLGPLIAETAETAERAQPAERPPAEVAVVEPPPEVVVEAQVPPAAAVPSILDRHFAVGLALGIAAGTTSTATAQNADALEDDNVPIGLRFAGSLPVPHGALRAIGSVLYTKGLNDSTDSTNTKKLYVVGAGVDYVWMPYRQIAFAAGLGMGWDHEVRAGDGGTDTARWTTLRASPLIYRLASGRIEVGLHTQLVIRDNGTGFLGLAAVDVFLL